LEEALGCGECELVLVEAHGCVRKLRLLAGPSPSLLSPSSPPCLHGTFGTDNAHPGVIAAPTVSALDALAPYLPSSLPVEATLAVIKPGAADTHYRDILEEITCAGFSVLSECRRTLTREEAEAFYAEHAGRAFFPALCAYMSSGPVVALALAKPAAIRAWRVLCGPTNTAVARRDKPASLRARFGVDGTRNATHGSDSPAAASREIRFYFPTLPLATEGACLGGEGAIAYIKNTVVAEVYDVAKGHTVSKTVDGVLVDALAELAKAKPSSSSEEAIAWLGQWLLDNNPRRGCVGASSSSASPLVELGEEEEENARSKGKLPPRRPRALARGAPRTTSTPAEQQQQALATTRKPTIVFVLGAPGSGKGTQCSLIAEKFGFTHLSTGDLLRAEVDSGGPLASEITAIMARGELVATSLILKIVESAMAASGSTKFLLDGYPRALDQAVQFEAAFGPPAFVLSLSAEESELEKRLVARGLTSGRADDNVETIRKRFSTFRAQSEPVIDFYARLGMLRPVSSMRSVDEVFADVTRCFQPQTAWLLGGPGSGRSTMSERVVKMGLGWHHISTGDLLRAEVAGGGPLADELRSVLNRGDGAPASLVVKLVQAAIERMDPVGRFVLDGGVRDMEMAVLFEGAFGTPSFIVSLVAPDALLLARASGRAHAGGGAPSVEETGAVHRKQLESYKSYTKPLIDMYAKKALAREVDASREEEAVWADVKSHFSPNVVFVLGGPGSGKGSACSRAATEFSYTHLCTGDLLREEVIRGSKTGGEINSHLTTGTLVPTEITISLIKSAIISSRSSHLLLDGFPRSMEQVVKFSEAVCLPSFVLYLECPEAVALARLSPHATHHSGITETAPALATRARTFAETSLPVIDLFSKQGCVRTVDASVEGVENVYASVREALLPTFVYALGYPGCGKGTQCSLLSQTYGYTHLRMGDMVREEVASGSEIGWGMKDLVESGEPVPDETLLKLATTAIRASGSSRFLLDGYPRTQAQASSLEAALGCQPAFALFFDLPKDTAKARLLKAAGVAPAAVGDEGDGGGEEGDAVAAASSSSSSGAEKNSVVSKINHRLEQFDSTTRPFVHALDTVRLLKSVPSLPPPATVFARVRRFFTPQVLVLLCDEGCMGEDFSRIVGRELGYCTLDVEALLAEEAARGSVDGKALGAAAKARRTPPLAPTLNVLERAIARNRATSRFVLKGFPRVISAGFPAVHDQVMVAEERLGAFKGAVVLSATLDVKVARAGAKVPGEVAVVRGRADAFRRECGPCINFFEKLGKVCSIDTSPASLTANDLLDATRPYLE